MHQKKSGKVIPDISLIITNYNYEQFLQECIESCLDQKTSFTKEIIVVDDGSTDRSKEIINKYSDNIKTIFKHNTGVENSSNIGILKSKANYVVRIDADDYLKPDFVELTLETLLSSNMSFIYSNYDAVNDKSEILWRSCLPVFNKDEIFSRGDFLATGTVYKKRDLLDLGLYNEKYKNCGLENFELIVSLLKNSNFGQLIDDNLFSYRIHSKNMSTSRRSDIISYGRRLCRLKGIGDYSTNEHHPYKLIL